MPVEASFWGTQRLPAVRSAKHMTVIEEHHIKSASRRLFNKKDLTTIDVFCPHVEEQHAGEERWIIDSIDPALGYGFIDLSIGRTKYELRSKPNTRIGLVDSSIIFESEARVLS